MATEDSTAPDLSVDLCGITLRNPTILASGILGLSRGLLQRVADSGTGAATIKSVTLEPRAGHNNPTVIAYEAGMLNAVGYSNPGIDATLDEFSDLDEVPIPVFASAVGQNAEEFAEATEKLLQCDFAAIELPLSCPHTPGYGTMAGHGTPATTEEIARAVRQVTDKPVFIKISPNVSAVGEVALAALEGGADGITAVNSLGPGMIINLETRTPVLGFRAGGVTGPALRPVAVRCIYDVRAAMRREGWDAPIIGVGGVSTGRHALEMIMAGANAVGVGTAVYQRGPEVFAKIRNELQRECNKLHISCLADAHASAQE